MPLGSFGGRSILLAPSFLSAFVAGLGDRGLAAQHAGAHGWHFDVMDGMFVPNISIGPPVVAALREVVNIPLDCHLMIMQPERYIAEFVAAGAAGITVHVEACTHLHRTIEQIKEHGVRAGVVLNPATPLVTLEEVLPMVDLVLVMSVNPGFGGQRYIPSATRRIERLRRMLDEQRLDHVHLQVDGGVKADNIAEIVAAGATNLVVGSAIFNRRRTVAEEIHTLHSALGA